VCAFDIELRIDMTAIKENITNEIECSTESELTLILKTSPDVELFKNKGS